MVATGPLVVRLFIIHNFVITSMKTLYKEIKGLIDPLEAYEISSIIKKLENKEGDSQVPKSWSYYNTSVCTILLGKLASCICKASGKKLIPSYAYCRVYLNGADLKPHKDRSSCEYSVTLNLSQTHPWPIYMGKKAITLNPGDGVLYKGCEIAHHRDTFEGEEYVQVFLHYVDADGPYKDHAYDVLNGRQPQQEYKFIFQRLNLFDNHLSYWKLNNALPLDIINDIREFCDVQNLADAEVGHNQVGRLDKTKRRTKVFWIPKNKQFLNLYRTFFDIINTCNNEFFQFRLHEMIENIQYSVYNSEDNGYYDWHTDMGSSNNRKLSLVCHLSDPSEYEGGELQINMSGKSIDTEKGLGNIIIFPSYLVHRVTPVTKGVRRTLVLWVAGPPFT